MSYNQNNKSIAFTFEFFDYRFGPLNENGYLQWCDFLYSVDGSNFTHLMRTEAFNQPRKQWSAMRMCFKKPGEIIEFINCFEPQIDSIWPEDVNNIVVVVADDINNDTGKKPHKTHKAYMTIRWLLDKSQKNIKFIKLIGFWKVNGIYIGDKINENYPLNFRTLKSNNMKDTPSILNSEICNTVKVTREADAIIVTGSKPGENIKVCTVSGTEVRSVVTNSDAVNIKVAKNQVYMVTVGKASYKVAL